MAPITIPPLATPVAHPRKQPLVLPPRVDPSCVLCLLPLPDTKWHDYSGHGNHAANHGPTWNSKGRLGPGLYFVTDDYFTVTAATSLDITTALTLEFWIKTSMSTVGHRYIMRKGEALGITLALHSGYVNAITGDGTNWHYANTNGSVSIADNVWHHIVKVVDAGTADTLKVYIDAVVDIDETYTWALGTNATKDLYIGGNAASEVYNGYIDEIRIYNRALAVDEIKALYDLGAEVRA